MSDAAVIPQLPALYGRKYQVLVSLPNLNTLLEITNSDNGPNALRVTFDIQTMAFATNWWADIIIWNPDAELIDQLLTNQAQGMTVTVSAGYQNGNYNVIWNGPVFQAFVERENVTDLKLTLFCMLRLPPLADATLAGATIAALQTQNQIVEKIAQLAAVPFNPAKISSSLVSTPLPRGMVVFGNMSKYITDIAQDNNCQWWIDQHGLNMGNITEDIQSGQGVDDNAPITFRPPAVPGAAGPLPSDPALLDGTPSIIGTPQQTAYGVNFRVLLDPRVIVQRPLLTVKINNSLLRFLKRTYGQNPRLLDQDGTYVALSVRYVGDTRGNPWYSEITGVTRGQTLLQMVAGVAGADLWRGSY